MQVDCDGEAARFLFLFFFFIKVMAMRAMVVAVVVPKVATKVESLTCVQD